MRENKYDDERFFAEYAQMPRSVDGLAGAGEWHAFRRMLPDLSGRRVLDLGCGFGWHCRYAAEQGAREVVGIDLSEKMLAEAARRNPHPRVAYRRLAIEDADWPDNRFDVILSSLALHYVADFPAVCRAAARLLTDGGLFVFSVEHPVFTASGTQDWCRDAAGRAMHWPVDRYFAEGARDTVFLGHGVVKYHRTLSAYVGGLLAHGLSLADLVEPEPDPALLAAHPEWSDELRRPMFLLVSARKAGTAVSGT